MNEGLHVVVLYWEALDWRTLSTSSWLKGAFGIESQKEHKPHVHGHILIKINMKLHYAK